MSGGRQYRLVRELGTGTFGTVYQAELQSMGDFRKDVALKVLHPMWERNADAAGRFRDEARLLGQIRHRHIVKVDGLVRVGGRWAVVMEYVEGVDANDLVKACRKAHEAYPVPAALEVVAAVASALDAAYHFAPEEADTALHVIHRDVKPSNVRLTLDGDVKVLDFGIAAADFEGREVVTDSVRYGSIRYMSPERRNEARDTASGDVYSLGCVLFELLVGRPFGNCELTFAEHQHKILRGMRRVTKRCGADAEAVVSLLERMLSFDEGSRPSAAEVADEARRLSRAIPGEDQLAFASRFLPRVPHLIGEEGVAMNRTVSADLGSSGEVLLDGGANPVLREETVAPMTRQKGPPPKPELPSQGVTLPVLTALVTVVIALLIQSLLPEQGAAYTADTRVVTLSAAGLSRPLPPPPAPATSEPVPDAAPAPATAPAPAPAAAPTPPHKPAPPRTPPPPPHGTANPAPPPHSAPAPAPKATAAPAKAASAPAAPASSAAAPAAVKFTVPGATSVRVDCPGASATGPTWALVHEPRAGTCHVHAQIGGAERTADVPLGTANEVTCAVQGDTLACR